MFLIALHLIFDNVSVLQFCSGKSPQGKELEQLCCWLLFYSGKVLAEAKKPHAQLDQDSRVVMVSYSLLKCSSSSPLLLPPVPPPLPSFHSV